MGERWIEHFFNSYNRRLDANERWKKKKNKLEREGDNSRNCDSL